MTGGRTSFSDPDPDPTFLTNEGVIYEPATDRWTSLPASSHPTYRAGDTCGLIKVGGTMVVGFAPIDAVEMLPTYGDCVPADVPWFTLNKSSVTLAPGEKIKVTVEVDSANLNEGSYEAGVWIKENTPYLKYPVDITATVKSRRWSSQ